MNVRSIIIWLMLIFCITGYQKGLAQDTPDLPEFETLTPQEQLPDPLVMMDGTVVTSPDQWNCKRRSEIKNLLRHYMYGYAPDAPDNMIYKIERTDTDYFGGKATLKQVVISFGPEGTPPINLLLVSPNNAGPVPVFFGLNFMGNHTVLDDPLIPLSKVWVASRGTGVVDNRATEASRGTSSSRWPIEMAIDRGYAVATLYYGDIDPDKPDYSDGVQSSYYADAQTKPARHEWGSIAAWAWGLSRAVDYLVTDRDIDSKRIAVMGHSRNGKAALLAGAMDERISLVVSNQSGCGGAAISRRRVGETVKKINDRFEHWFNDEFKKFNEKEDFLPLDQHMLIALSAPRPVLVASAAGDKWADPEGEFLALKAANSVYDLLDTDTLTAEKMPDENTLIGNTQGYHIRPGKHGVGSIDWNVFMDFADKHFKAKFANVDNLPIQKSMPDPFLMSDGKSVQSLEDWDKQREYIKSMLEHYLYGSIPPLPKKIEVKQIGSKSVFDGKGIEESYTLTIRRNGKSASCRFLVVRPALKKRYPAIIKNDILSVGGSPKKKASHDTFDPAAEAVNLGYLLCRFQRTDLASDTQKDGRKGGVYPLYPEYDFGALAVWGWAHGVVLDALDQLGLADMSMVVATGHSRGGKAALCAGIYDDRVSITAPNSSGTGGTGSLRYFEDGQRQQLLGHHIGKNEHWFGPRHFQFAGKEDRLPYDSHFALAAVAPRAFVNCHARQDYWANPYGTELTHRAARIVYEWMGVKDRIGLHWRDGGHAQGQEDWTALLDFSDRYFFDKKTNRKFDEWTYPDASLDSVVNWSAPQLDPDDSKAGYHGPKDKLHVYLLIGQSNMAGRAPFTKEESDAIERCYLLNSDGNWQPAKNPLNRYSTVRKSLSMQKMNPGYTFAQTMLKEQADISLGLVVNAKGGTRIEQWAKGTGFYNEAIRRAKIAQADGTLKGILWHQGESNSKYPDSYPGKLKSLVEDLRNDLSMPDLPFVAGQLFYNAETKPHTKQINEQIKKIPETLHLTGCVSSDGLITMDNTHFDSKSMRLLGQRYAKEMQKLKKKSD